MAMNAKVSEVRTENNHLYFTLTDVNVCYANALRRTMIANIPIVAFQPEINGEIKHNTTRLHNELLKQRLSCIPINIGMAHSLRKHIDNYIVEIDEENNTDTVMYVTTKHFKIRDLRTDELLDDAKVKEIFPPFIPSTGQGEYYIDFVRLRPRISAEIPGEKIKLTCKLSTATGSLNSMFNCTGTCSYGCTPSKSKMEEQLEIRKQKWKDEGKSAEEVKFEAANWRLLEGLRYVVENSFDFIMQSVGIDTNEEIIVIACDILMAQLERMDAEIDNDSVPIAPSDNIIDNCYDVTLVNESYTLGNMLNYEIYTVFYTELQLVDFVGYKKYHPHDKDSVLRISLKDKTQGVNNLKTILKTAIDRSRQTVLSIKKLFKA